MARKLTTRQKNLLNTLFEQAQKKPIDWDDLPVAAQIKLTNLNDYETIIWDVNRHLGDLHSEHMYRKDVRGW